MSYQAIPLNDDEGVNDNAVFENYSHFDEDMAAPGLPATIYTTAIICSLGFTKEELYSSRSTFVLLPQWFNIAFNFFFSLVVIECVRQLRDETPECESSFLLTICCVISFTCYNVAEVFETFWMIHWIYSQPTCEEHQRLKFSTVNDEKEIVSGMTAAYKWWCYLYVIAPKLLIGGLLTYYGNTFLWVSDTNQDVILNAMSLGFITQNDEAMFATLVPQHMKDAAENLPPAKVSNAAKVTFLFEPYFAMVAVAVIVFATYADVCFDDVKT